MKSIFYNSVEKRIRTGWRLVIQFLLYLLTTAILGAGFGIVAVLFLFATGGLQLDNPAKIQEAIMGIPWFAVLSTFISLIAMVFSMWVGTKMDKRPFRNYGFRFSAKWWKDLAFGLFLGAFLMAIIFIVELVMGWVTITGFFKPAGSGSFLMGIVFATFNFIFVGIYEEMMSRGYQIHNLAEGLRGKILSPKFALLLSYILTSSFFGFLHYTNPNATLVSTLLLILAGLFLGLGYILTGELALPIGLHITWNFFQGNVFGFPVSGTQAGATFIGIQQGGPDFWTGGAFGPESGLLGVLAIALGMVMIVFWTKLNHNQVRVHEELAHYPDPEPGQNTVVEVPVGEA